ncbi:MAG: hypothetical protein WC538_05265 [Thermoanaerobaculia bacterium]
MVFWFIASIRAWEDREPLIQIQQSQPIKSVATTSMTRIGSTVRLPGTARPRRF